MKKNIYLLIITFVLSAVSAFPVIAAETLDARIQLITDLGIVTGDESNDLMLDKNITRAEMATVVYRLKYGDAEIRASKQVFSDVEVNHWAAPAIEMLYDTNVVSGDGDGRFRPSDNVCTSELYKMLLNIAGYSLYMEDIGDYPGNAMQAAMKSGLSKGINLPYDKTLTREEAFIIIYNLLDVETMVTMNGVADSGYKEGPIFLNQELEVYKAKGIVTGAATVAADGSTLAEGMAQIYMVMYEDRAGLSASDIGLKGEYYYKTEKDGSRVLLSFIPIDKNNIVEINARDIVSYESNKYTYYDETGKQKTAKINPGKDIYYNEHTVLSEIYEEDGVEKSYMIPQYGKVILVDNDGDKTYDAVRIEEYINMLCTQVSENSETIFGKINGEVVTIELSRFEDYTILDKDGNSVALRSIAPDTLLAIQYYDDKSGVTITVCSDVKEGTITSVTNNEYDEKTILHDGKKYVIALSNAIGDEEIKFNQNTLVHFDIYGNVGAITYNGTKSQWKYGFVLKLACEVENDIEPVSIKLFDTASGEIRDYECDEEKLRFDNDSCTRADIAEKVEYGTVIRYMLGSENKIIRLDTPVAKDITEWDGEVNDNDSLMERVAKGTKVCKTSNMAFFSGKHAVFYDANTQFLYASDLASGQTYKDGNYAKRTSSNLVHKGVYTAAAYNTDPKKMVADLIILYENENNELEGADAMLVKRVSQAVNDDGEVVYQITGLYGGQNASYTLRDNEMLNIGNHTITRGDAIKIRVISGEITNVQLVYSPSDPYADESILGPSKKTTTSTNWDANAKYEFGWIERVESPNVVFKREVSSAAEYPHSFYNAVKYFFIYVYDKNNPKDDAIRIGTIDDIKSEEYYPGEYDTVVLGAQSSNGQVMILYRN